eukprot:TRINITY_DN2751_c0_g2_i1.p1 TRINITY_DN2751_c0_g2~~TRINITY_DN2751_c0_g2_i1.p1  ORF type:complete len:897 (+),score=223.32 TRINITY_DN2751_c0_g2_i1:31-2691(+)
MKFFSIQLILLLIGFCFCHYNLIEQEGEGCSFFGQLGLINLDDTAFGEPLFNDVTVSISCYSNDMIFVNIQSNQSTRAHSFFDYGENKNLTDKFKFEIQSYPFTLKIVRKLDNFVLFDSTRNDYLVLTEHYVSIRLEMGTNSHYYGFGERNGDFKLKNDQRYILYAKDNGGCPVGMPCYASHPFGLRSTIINGVPKYSGIFWHNTHMLRVTPHDDNIHFDGTGGTLNFAIYGGQNPLEILKDQRVNFGLPIQVPDWALGWQQCRWGFHDLNEVKDVVKNYTLYGIPLEIIYMDIDYMDGYRDFTSDPVRFPTAEIKEFSDSLHNNGQRLAMIIDPGIKYESGYEPYDRLLKTGAFIRRPNGSPVINSVWPGSCIFPDFSDERSHDWWAIELEEWWKKTGFDLCWIDMNEPAAFDKPKFELFNGEILDKEEMLARRAQRQKLRKDRNSGRGMRRQSDDSFDKKVSVQRKNLRRSIFGDFDPNNPPFNPGNFPLNQHSLDARSQTYYGSMYSEHNLYGYWESIATRKAFDKFRPNERVPVVSRSTFPGSGKYVSSWLGDDASTWLELQLSIPNLIQMNVQGIMLIGPDIGGFLGGDLSDNFELVARWIEAFSLAPFARMHTANSRPAQYPWTWNKLIPIAKKYINNRYTHMPYLYKTMLLSQQQGIPFWQPLWMGYPNDKNMVVAPDTQFLVGKDILQVPVITPETDHVIVNFPSSSLSHCDAWYHYDQLGTDLWYVPGQPTKIMTPLDATNIFYRGGSMMLTTIAPQNTVSKARRADMVLNVFLDRCGNADGTSLMDDGLTYDSKQYRARLYASAMKKVLTLSPEVVDWKEAQNIKVTKIRVIGLMGSNPQFRIGTKPVKFNKIGNSSMNYEVSVTFTLDKGIVIAW